MPLRTITIRQIPFTFPDRYGPGHQLTEIEAEALNALRAENIRNNVMKLVPEAGAGEHELQVLRERITAYAESYEFGRNAQRVKSTPLEQELDLVARNAAEAEANIQGQGGNEEWIMAFTARYRALPETLVQAQINIARRARLAAEVLEELK